MPDILFDDWTTLGRTLLIGMLAYAGLVVLLRMSGNRTLSKMNAFDLVVTVALGSTLSTILLDRSVSLSEGLTALALLIGMQYLVTWTSVRWRWVRATATGEPVRLVSAGELREQVSRRVRVTPDEVLAACRASGLTAVDQAEAVYLETDGSFSVIPRNQQS